jgi:hypothetical protein
MTTGRGEMSEGLQSCLGIIIILACCGGAYAIPLTRGWMTSAWGWASSTFFAEKPWKGVYYAEAASSVAKDKNFKTLQDCRAWANDQADRDNKEPGEWDYSCGYKCKYTSDPLRRASPGFNFDCEQVTR